MKIVQIVNLWTLVGHPAGKTEWSLARKLQAIRAAGFEGITTALTPEIRAAAEKAELEHLLGFISTSDPAEHDQRLRAQKEAGAKHINVQFGDHDTPPALAAKQWVRFERLAEKIGGIIPSLEVHRDTCTETPEKTYEIASRYHDATGRLLKFTFDFSHLAAVKHLRPADYATRLLDHPDLMANCEQSHCRPFNGHHAQVPVTWKGKLSPEVQSYLVFVQAMFRIWQTAPQNANRTLFVCPEMGPVAPEGGGYNLSGLPASWPEAIRLRPELEKAWQRAGRPTAKTKLK